MAPSRSHLASALMCIALLVASASASYFTSIDCGATSSYIDQNNISWDTDASYIVNGENHIVKSTGSVSKEMRTLRVFTSRKKNCYPIGVSIGGRILVRVSFYYGNYDGKSSPPTFALQFDANEWETVVTSADGIVYYEAIYDVLDGTSVCVAQTKSGQLPFVSAIEVRTLGTGMYKGVDSSFALFLQSRSAFGAQGTVRYPNDQYDRIWDPSPAGDGAADMTSDTTVMDPTTVGDYPPVDVLMNAVTTAGNSTDLFLTFSDLPATVVPVYINLYFAEMVELNSTDVRSFQVYKDNELIIKSIVPTYQSATEYYITDTNYTASTKLSLTPMATSTLPPIISAMEVFIARDGLSNGTDAADVEALLALQKQYDVLYDWSGDPCLPANYNFDWVACSSDPVPRITALYLSGYGLKGELPDISSMNALQTIDLSNNSISGSIPDFLGSLPRLKELNLADNMLSGVVPSSLTRNNKIKLTISGNPYLCASSKSGCYSTNSPTTTQYPDFSVTKTKKKSNRGVIAGVTIPLVFIVAVISAAIAFLRSRRATAPVAAANTVQMSPSGTPIGGQANKLQQGARPPAGGQAPIAATFSWKHAASTACFLYKCFFNENEEQENGAAVEEQDIEQQQEQEVEMEPTEYNAELVEEGNGVAVEEDEDDAGNDEDDAEEDSEGSSGKHRRKHGPGKKTKGRGATSKKSGGGAAAAKW